MQPATGGTMLLAIVLLLHAIAASTAMYIDGELFSLFTGNFFNRIPLFESFTYFSIERLLKGT